MVELWKATGVDPMCPIINGVVLVHTLFMRRGLVFFFRQAHLPRR